MVVSILLRLTHINKQSRKVKCVGRSTNLIIDYSYFIMSLSHFNHGLDEVLTIQTKYPCDTNNEIFIQCLAHSQLTFQFCLAINIKRLVILAVRMPRFCSFAIKYIICGEIQLFAIQLFAYTSNILCAAGIYSSHSLNFVIILCHIYSSPSCTMYNSVRFDFRDNLFDCFFISNIKANIGHRRNSGSTSNSCICRCNIGTNTFMTSFIQFIHDVMAQLTIDSCYKELHIISSCIFRTTTAANGDVSA